MNFIRDILKQTVPGVDDNAYTNIMAVWTLRCARHLLQILPDYQRTHLMAELCIDQPELDRWEEISRRMFVPFHDQEIISQFAGYEHLQELDWARYRSHYGDIRRIDWILEAEGDSVNRYKVSKQPDVLMICYLLSLEELESLFADLHYPFSLPMLRNNIAYYQNRTSQGSTLSRIVHGWILARSDRRRSWQCLIEALGNDVHQIKGGSTGEGVHLGAMAGTIDLVQRCYSGIDIGHHTLELNPRLPDSLREVDMTLHYCQHRIHVQITQKSLFLQVSAGPHFPFPITVRGKKFMIDSSQTQEYLL